MNLIVNRTDTVSVTVYCFEQDGGIEASHEKSEVPENIEVCQTVVFKFRKPGHADSNAIIRNSSFKVDGDDTNFSPSEFQDQVLRTLLVGWDLKTEEGKAIAVNPMNVGNLLPSVARAAVTGALEKIRI